MKDVRESAEQFFACIFSVVTEAIVEKLKVRFRPVQNDNREFHFFC